MELNFSSYTLSKLHFDDLLIQDVTKLINGELFFLTKTWSGVAAGTYSLAVTTSEKPVVMAFDFGCSDKLRTQLFEAADISGGTTLDLINRNRTSSNTINISVVDAPTVSSSGTQIADALEGTQVSRRIGNNVALSTDGMYLLRPNTTYLIQYTTYTTADVSLIMNIFELQTD